MGTLRLNCHCGIRSEFAQQEFGFEPPRPLQCICIIWSSLTRKSGHGRSRFRFNILASSILYAGRRSVMDHIAGLRLPAIYQWPEYAAEGGLAGYGPTQASISRLVAEQVDRVLKGTRPADLPVVQPTKFELAINLKTAKALGLTVPQSLLLRADEVIE